MDIEKEFQSEFDLLKNEGRLTDDWSNIYNHCKLEGEIAAILGRLVNLDDADSKILIKAAILHDWYKRKEIEQSKGLNATAYKKSEHESYTKLLELGVPKRIVEVAHSVGALSVKEIIESQDLLKKLMHLIDDICLGNKIVEIDKRIDYNESKYPQINVEGKELFSGKTYFEMQRKVGKQIQLEIEDILKIEPNSLIPLIKNHWENLKKAPWRKKFLNVLERTFTELNLEFTNFSIGQISNGDFKKRYFDTNIQGIEFSDELTVCSAIINDCLASPLLNGTIDDDQPEEFKFYNVRREEPINKNTKERIDIVLQRVKQNHIFNMAKGETISAEDLDLDCKPVYIEAKRAKTYPNKKLSQDFVPGTPTKILLKRFESSEKRFNYILVWGVFDKNKEKNNTPDNYIKKQRDNNNYQFEKCIRWIPISWEKESDLRPPEQLNITRWLWILLAQVEPKK